MMHIAITARQGSKRIKNKNKVLLNGKPLVQHTLEFANIALNRGLADSASIISDDDDILALSRNLALDVSYSRPDELSGDLTTTQETLKHWIDFKGFSPDDNILLLQPTSPYRFINDLVRLKDHYLLSNQLIYGVVSLPGKSSDYFSESKSSLPESDNKVYFIDGSYYYASVGRILSKSGLAVQQTDHFFVTSLPFPIDIDTQGDLDSLSLLNSARLNDCFS